MSDIILGFCCNYTSSVDEDTLKKAGLVPDGLRIKRLPCTGKLEINTLLDAFEQGAEAVFVAGCQVDKCHNLSGSQRAAKRVGYAKKILEELGIDPARLEMFFVSRGETEPIVEAARHMSGVLSDAESIHR